MPLDIDIGDAEAMVAMGMLVESDDGIALVLVEGLTVEEARAAVKTYTSLKPRLRMG